MKIFSSVQIKEIDEFTIKNEPISSIDLMERAASTIYQKIIKTYNKSTVFKIFAGSGNNGGDALVIARLLAQSNYQVEIFMFESTNLSEDTKINIERIKKDNTLIIQIINNKNQFPLISSDCIIIDGLFGSGLNKPLDGVNAQLVKHINKSKADIIAIDIPSGIFGENNTTENKETAIKATKTYCFEFPKLAFMFPENDEFIGSWKILPISLHSAFIEQKETTYFYTTIQDIAKKIISRNKFSHKGSFGHALLIAGSYSKMGAAVLSARACLRSGVGLLTTHTPICGNTVINKAIPESMTSIDESKHFFSKVPNIESYQAIGIGPGLGKAEETQKAFYQLLEVNNQPMVIDADAINILSENKKWLDKLPKNSILTPHPKEFERLLGKFENHYERMLAQIEFTKKHHVIIVLKGANTCVALPDGTCHFNSTGNPGMATAGSGDVLTGIILSLLAQGYAPSDAAIIGVFLHGLAGDIASNSSSEESLIASDITENLGLAFKKIKEAK